MTRRLAVRRAARIVGATVVVVVTVLGLGLFALPGAQAEDAKAVLERARTATVSEDFSGLVQIEWISDGHWQTARVPVSGTGGTVQVGDGTRKAESSGNDRWIATVGGWQAGWDEPVTGAVPSPAKNWRLEVAKGPEIAGRTTTVVTATDPHTARARLKVYVDRETGVMLRREVLDQRGDVVRAVGFVQVKKLGGARSAAPAKPKVKAKAKDQSPVKVASVPDGFIAPAKVGATYVLAGRYVRDDNIVQLYYSDGLFGVSLFEQRGNLDWNGLPRGGNGIDVNGVHARDYEVAGGTVLVWEHDGITNTLVSDATVADLRAFATAYDEHDAGHHGGLLNDVADFVLGPFGWN